MLALPSRPSPSSRWFPLTYYRHVGIHSVLLEARELGQNLAAQLPGGAVVNVREDHLVQARRFELRERGERLGHTRANHLESLVRGRHERRRRRRRGGSWAAGGATRGSNKAGSLLLAKVFGK